jgi:hypothetical protein
MAATGVPLRTLQEWMGHADYKTTLVYADYAPSAHEAEWAEKAFASPDAEQTRDFGHRYTGHLLRTAPPERQSCLDT